MSGTWRSTSRTAWRRWRRFAHRAAEIQSRVLLFLLYFVFVAPIGLVMLMINRRRPNRGDGTWTPVGSPPETLESAKNQF